MISKTLKILQLQNAAKILVRMKIRCKLCSCI